MSGLLREIEATEIATPQQFVSEVAAHCRPVILRGLVRHWPVVQAGAQSPHQLYEYLKQFDAGLQTEVFIGESAIAGKYYYNEDMKGFNFDRKGMRFIDALQTAVSSVGQKDAASIYIGSIPINNYLPGLVAQNSIQWLPSNLMPRIWLGHASNVSLHYDAFENIACVIAGKRRFTLFPPEAISRLYVGPIDNTMAGQPVSLAASSPFDPDRFPLYEEIRDQALDAVLEPGDALYLPKLWWHKVEATAPFNGLINYWWDAFSSGPDAPYASLLLSMITVAERPLLERLAWRAYFDHYVFRPNGHPLQHLPAEQHGLLGPLKDTYGRLRTRVMHMLRGGY